MSNILAGVLAALPLAVVLILYACVRGRALAAFFQQQSPEIDKMSQNSLFWIILAGFTGMALTFGLLSGLIYGWLGLPNYRYLAFGAALLLSAIALISKTPLVSDKIAWNLAVGGILGWLVPILAG